MLWVHMPGKLNQRRPAFFIAIAFQRCEIIG